MHACTRCLILDVPAHGDTYAPTPICDCQAGTEADYGSLDEALGRQLDHNRRRAGRERILADIYGTPSPR